MAQYRIILLIVTLCFGVSSSNANDETIAGDWNQNDFDTEIAEEVIFPEPSQNGKLFPLGHLLVNRETNEGLVLACTELGEAGCKKFRFAYFPHANELKQWSWASNNFQVDPNLGSLSARKQKRALKKWVRNSARLRIEMDVYSRRTIGVWLGLGSIVGSMAILDGTPGDNPLGYLPLGIAGLVTILWFAQKSEYMDIMTPLARATARAVVSRRPDQLQKMDENYLLIKTTVRDALFKRLISGTHQISAPFVATP